MVVYFLSIEMMSMNCLTVFLFVISYQYSRPFVKELFKMASLLPNILKLTYEASKFSFSSKT